MSGVRSFAPVTAFAQTARTPGTAAAARPAITTGTVVDISGAVDSRRRGDRRVRRDGRTSTVTTDADGNFDAGVAARRACRSSRRVSKRSTVEVSGAGPVQVVLRPVNFADSVVVTATRGAERLPSAASSTVLDRRPS